jgi:HD-GYP domain-containing protein (c-di-GMP phosphodiesterase class II)
MLQNTHYTPNTYLSTFLAAKYLGVSAFELNRLAEAKKIRTYTVDRYGEKFLVRDLNRFKDLLQPACQKIDNQAAEPDPRVSPPTSARVNYDDIIALHLFNDERQEYFEIPKPLVGLIATVPLFCKSARDNYVIYKNAGVVLAADRLEESKFPTLYIRKEDKTAGATDIHLKHQESLRQQLYVEDCDAIKRTLAVIFENILFHPAPAVIRLLGESVDSVIEGYVQSSRLKEMIYATLGQNISVAIHCVNILCLALRFCYYNSYSIDNSREIVLSALLHDIGKAPIPPEILSGTDRTLDEENILRCHTVIGGRLLEKCDFVSPAIGLGALEHHERLDGSGYPFGATRMSFFGQLVAILDTYDCIMSQAKKTGKPFNAFNALSSIKQDVELGRFSRDIFQQFMHSLT